MFPDLAALCEAGAGVRQTVNAGNTDSDVPESSNEAGNEANGDAGAKSFAPYSPWSHPPAQRTITSATPASPTPPERSNGARESRRVRETREVRPLRDDWTGIIGGVDEEIEDP